MPHLVSDKDSKGLTMVNGSQRGGWNLRVSRKWPTGVDTPYLETPAPTLGLKVSKYTFLLVS